jgi:hypothetical protein
MKSLLNAVLGLKDVEVSGNMHVGTFQKKFKESFGTEIRLYKGLNTGKGCRRADEKATMSSICGEGIKVQNIVIKKSHSVGDIELQFKTQMGIGVQIMLPDGKTFAPNDMKLKDVAKTC